MKHKTNWTRYYDRPFKAASFSRQITGRILIDAITRSVKNKKSVDLIELGGANSAFLELILQRIKPSRYTIVDANRPGLDKTKKRLKPSDPVELVQADILSGNLDIPKADLVVSVGLIEHFDKKGTRKAIQSHFNLLKSGGVAVITFPTPTFLYRTARFIAEVSGTWIFHDERPLRFKEVLNTANANARLVEKRIIWPIIFTQGLVVFQKDE